MLQRDSLYQRLYLHDVVIEKEASDFSQDDLVSTGSSESENLYVTSILQKVLNVKQQNKTNKLPVGEDTSPRGVSMRTVPIDKVDFPAKSIIIGFSFDKFCIINVHSVPLLLIA